MSETKTAETKPAADYASGGDHHHHGPSMKIYVGVWLALMFLTWVTVAVAEFDFGEANIWIAMLIATVKASLVVLFFMHLAFERLLYAIILIISLLFVSLFISLSVVDTAQYEPQIRTDYETQWDAAAEAAKTKK